MANIKISELSSWTGTPADLRWFVMNDEGENTTYKFSGYTSQLYPGEGTDSSVSLNYVSTDNKGDYSSIIGGISNDITYSTGRIVNSVILGGSGHTIGGVSANATANEGNFIIGGDNNTINDGEQRWTGIIGGYNNTTNGGAYESVILGGDHNTISSQRSVIAGGDFHTMSGGYNHFIAGANNCSIGGGEFNSIITARGSNIGGGNDNTILGGQSNQIAATFKSAVIGGESNQIVGDMRGSAILAGYSNIMGGGNGQHNLILGGEQNTNDGSSEPRLMAQVNNQLCEIFGNAGGYRFNFLANSYESDITDSTFTTIINTSGTSLNGVNNVVVLGVNDLTSALDNTTYVDNSHTKRTESFDVIAVGNVGGTIDVDCSLGTIFTFALTADTTPNFINLRSGQRFIFIVENTTFNVPTATINGVGGNVYAKNGTISPSNNSITKYTATYDGTRMFLDEELQFDAV